VVCDKEKKIKFKDVIPPTCIAETGNSGHEHRTFDVLQNTEELVKL